MTRRSVLAAASVAATAITPVLGGSTTGSVESTTSQGCDPTRHGFGFHNWPVEEGPYPGTPEGIEEGWREPFGRAFDRPLSELPAGLLERFAQHAREGLLEAVGTSGYCYGMIFAAQRYFERPGTIPAGFETASEIVHPNAPRAIEGTPVLDDIIEYHAAQYVDFYAWLGRYALFDASLIDYESQMTELLATLDTFGTAGITLFSATAARSHQVLVYDYERRPGLTTLFAYNPNYPAGIYEDFTATIEIDTSGEKPVPRPIEYGTTYDQFIHNEYSRAIRTRRDSSGPFVTGGDSLFERLFGTTLFVRTTPSIETTVVDPIGRRLASTGGTEPLHYRYGATEGTYRIALTGRETDEYALDVYAGSQHRTFLDETIEGSIAPNETERYAVTIESEGASLETDLGGAALLGAIGTGYAYHVR